VWGILNQKVDDVAKVIAPRIELGTFEKEDAVPPLLSMKKYHEYPASRAF
jgi:hypothetical protein